MAVESCLTNLPVLVMVLGGECGCIFHALMVHSKVILHTSEKSQESNYTRSSYHTPPAITSKRLALPSSTSSDINQLRISSELLITCKHIPLLGERAQYQLHATICLQWEHY